MTLTQPHRPTTIAIPRHVAIIMDGNGRWAQKRGLHRLMGHRAGIDALKRVVTAAQKFGIQYLTVYAFSTENWQRPSWEVSGLLQLLSEYLPSYGAELTRQGVRLRMIGNHERLTSGLKSQINNIQEQTRHNNGLHLTIAFGYGARDEIMDAVRHIARQAQAGDIDPEAISEDMFTSALSTHDLPDPDLLIRTSGELRISNFLLWQLAYTELFFTETLWPDFDEETLGIALQNYAGRERRYGRI
jgi:undecaprenyl diphosphate synthase